MSENDAEFIEIMMQDGDWQPGSRMHRLALLARRGADRCRPRRTGGTQMSEWTYIKIGDRRPQGPVLVAYMDETDRRFLEAVFGETAPKSCVAIATWNKSKSVWTTDHWYIRTVYAWMPLPAPPTEASDDQ